MFLSVVIPCFNEEEVIELTLNRFDELLHLWIQEDKIKKFELVLIDDGSQDSTGEILKNKAMKASTLKVIRFSRNFGHQAALLAGYHHAEGDAIVTMDADLQHPPELIAAMLDRVRSGYDIIYAVQKNRNSDSWFKRSTAKLFYHLMHRLGTKVIPQHGDFRLITRRVLLEFFRFGEVQLFIRAAFPAIGFPSTTIDYRREKRAAGKSKYPFKKMLEFALEGITSFSVVPLRICSLVGFVISLISVGLLLWTLIVKITGNAVQGWASTLVPLYFLGGIQLIFLGVIGEYIGKIYMETKARPRYIVEKAYNVNPKSRE